MTYQVKWRLGGTRAGQWQSESFTAEARAQSFRLDVEDAGHHWPDGWVKGAGYVKEAVTPPAPEPTFTDVAAAYFAHQERRIKRGKITLHTLRRDQRACELHLTPTFGPTPFVDIAAEDVEQWIDDQLDGGASPKSVRNRHGLLAAICGYGSKAMRLRPDLPTASTDLPALHATEARQVRFFQHGEWARLRNCLNPDVHLLVDTLLATGARWGEATAMRVSDAQVNAREETVVLQIQRAWSQRSIDDHARIDANAGETKAWRLGPPKSRRSRFVVVSGETATTLIAHLAGREPSAYIFTTKGGSPWRYPEFHSLRWKPARLEAEKRGLSKHATIHMLRHTFAVWALSEAVAIQVVSEALGHSSIQITWQVYGGVLDLTDPTVARAMAASMLTAAKATVPAAPAQSDGDAKAAEPLRRSGAR